MIIKIPFKTPCGNHYLAFRGYHQYIKPEAKKLKKEIITIVRDRPIEELESIPTDRPLKVVINIHENWYYLNGNVKRQDVANREKFLIDSIFEALEIDDKMIFDIQMIKIQDEENEFSMISIEEL